MLARREHSAQELIRKLSAGAQDAAVVQSVIVQLAEEGLQSDSRFAEMYIHARVEKGHGPVSIRYELRERGISADLINLHLDVYTHEWPARAARAREKRFGNKLPPDFRERAKQMRFLQQRGFSGEQIRNIFNAGDE